MPDLARTTPTRRLAALPRVVLLFALIAAPAAFAGPPVPVPAPAGAATPPAWEQLSEAQREALIAPIRERWNNEPDARQRMLEHARRWQELSPEQRRKARHGRHRWEDMSPEQRRQTRALFEAMRGMTSEQRRELKAAWRAMTPAQRDAWVRQRRAD